MFMPMSRRCTIFVIGMLSLLFSSCYHQESETSDAWIVTEEQMDSISFYTTHHYTQNYNFLVTADSLWLDLFIDSYEELCNKTMQDYAASLKWEITSLMMSGVCFDDARKEWDI
jgi:hypothetical protein